MQSDGKGWLSAASQEAVIGPPAAESPFRRLWHAVLAPPVVKSDRIRTCVMGVKGASGFVCVGDFALIRIFVDGVTA